MEEVEKVVKKLDTKPQERTTYQQNYFNMVGMN
jgi:hypothetical protein